MISVLTFSGPFVFFPLQLSKIENDLQRFGERVAKELPALARQADVEVPRLVQFDAWGQRIDQVVTSPAWKYMHGVAAEEGLIAIAYDKENGGEYRFVAGLCSWNTCIC